MAALPGDDFNVKIVRKEVVVNTHPVQKHRLPLSNLDLTIPPVSVSLFLCYKQPTPRSVSSFAEEATHDLKISLSEAFAYYYVFAGQMVSNTSGEPELLCNDQGVEFVQAAANIGLAELDFYNPDKTIEGKLVPMLSNNSVFSTQVTTFSCGGIIIGCTFDHRIADAFSTNMFLLSWAKLTRKESIEMLKPNFDRSVLLPRRPPHYCSAIDEMYTRHSSLHLEKSKKQDPPPSLVSRIYYLTAKDVEFLQSNANEHGELYSKLVAFSAYLWKLLILSQEIHNDRNCSIGVVIDGRTRLTNKGIPSNYFGNVLLLPCVEAQASDIKSQPLSWSAKLIHNVIYRAANEEHFQSLIDWVEMIRPDPGLATIYCKRDMAESNGPSILVSSGLRFPLSKIDFGWGNPCFGSYHFPWGGEAGYVMPLPSPLGDGSWVVYMHLPMNQLEAIESHVDCLFRRITPNFLGMS
eukprot:PITA_13452